LATIFAKEMNILAICLNLHTKHFPNMSYSKKFFLAAIAVLFSLNLSAQWYRNRIIENPDRASGVYHYYEYANTTIADAPKGYKPFYISHYGRHGSRYHQSGRTFMYAIQVLDSARNAGLLTEEGKLLSRQLDTIWNEHQGMFGMLTERGKAEHMAIAGRMYDNFRQVFKGRKEVDCVSSYWPRCLVSMASFTESLLKDDDDLNVHYQTGPKYLDYISMDLWSAEYDRRCDALVEHLKDSLIKTDRFFGKIFMDPEKAYSFVKNPKELLYQTYMTGCISQNTEARPDIFSHLSIDELVACWIPSNSRLYYTYGISADAGDFYAQIAKPLIEDFIAKADAALAEDSDRAADLRFGHDTGLLPLAGTLGIKIGSLPAEEGLQQRWPSAKVHEHFANFDMIPMGSNIQMVFYRNRKGDVIVRLLYNEMDAIIPALKSWDGPFYKWSDLREYLTGLVSSIKEYNPVRDLAIEERTGVETQAASITNPY
jgi:hypothetical protein